MRRILFVDDEPNMLRGLERMLRPMRHEWEMTFLDSGQKALDAFRQSPFDVVVSDFRMPGMDGATLLSEIKKISPDSVRMILSGQVSPEVAMRTVRAAHRFLSKPCDPETLKATIARAFALRKLLSDATLKQRLSQIVSIPSLPSVYSEIMDEMQSPGGSLAKVGEIVSKDIGMTAKILQIVNSAFFGVPRHVASPAEAAGLLGFDIVKSLALSLDIFARFDRGKLPDFSIDRLWEHSLAVGVEAKDLAKEEHAPRHVCDDAFMAGVLHDVGKLILADNLPVPYGRALALSRSRGIPNVQAEQQMFGFTHAEVGAYLLGLWGLPDAIVEAVAYHHCPEKCPATEFTPLKAVAKANCSVLGIEPIEPAQAEPEAPKPAPAPAEAQRTPERPAPAPAATHAVEPPQRARRPEGTEPGSASGSILCVDDDPNILTAYQRALRKRFSIDTALGPEEGLKKINRFGPYGVVVSDLRMPGMDGIQFLAKVREISPDTVRIMLTGHADLSVTIDAVNEGNIFRFLMKPCEPDIMAAALQAGLQQYGLVTAERQLLDQTLTGSVQAMTDLLATVDSERSGQRTVLRDYVRTLANALHMTDSWQLEVAAMLHDVGSITLPPEVMVKTRNGSPLSDPEEQILERVPEIGYNLLRNIPRLEPVARAIRYQDKNYDGSGIPEDGVAGQAIPIGARILRVLKDFNELTLANQSVSEAFDVMGTRSGRYDPKVLGAIETVLKAAAGERADAGARPTTSVFLKDLAVGQVLAGDVKTSQGRLLISAGHRITGPILAKIHNYDTLTGVVEPVRIYQT
ncbi:HDOD domain-containing protein [Candidatus Sumerlaeota bacterium]|nr:HDOD domain-containing protein [Candidatus Sumerlaeota bacterium]